MLVSICDKNYIHLSVNHIKHFKDPATGACTNRIESIWNVAKSKNKKRYGTHRSMVDSYLCEFVWRQQNKEKDIFEEILIDIVKYNPLC